MHRIPEPDLARTTDCSGKVISGEILPTSVTVPPLRTLAIAVWMGSVARH